MLHNFCRLSPPLPELDYMLLWCIGYNRKFPGITQRASPAPSTNWPGRLRTDGYGQEPFCACPGSMWTTTEPPEICPGTRHHKKLQRREEPEIHHQQPRPLVETCGRPWVIMVEGLSIDLDSSHIQRVWFVGHALKYEHTV